jgi:hypothetical protein
MRGLIRSIRCWPGLISRLAIVPPWFRHTGIQDGRHPVIMRTHTHREPMPHAAPPAEPRADLRAKPHKGFDACVDVGTGLAVALGLLVAIQLIARG